MTYDLMILGGGPAGYVAAERAGERGLRVLLVEKDQLGGVCLNRGCIPSKTLLQSAKVFHYATHGAAYGVTVGEAKFSLAPAMERKRKVVETLRKGVAGMMKRGKVEVVAGEGRLVGRNRIAVDGREFEGANILIATGSSPARPPIPGIDNACVYDSTRILDIETLPERIVIVGAGVIGCEFACFFAAVGVPVTVIEMLPEICPSVDEEVARMLRQELTAKGVTFHLGARVERILADGVEFSLNGKTAKAEAGHVLVATGRVCNVQGIGLEEAGVDFDRRGVRVDDRCATNVPGVWAAGDVTGRQWLAHAASRMGEVVVHNIAGRADTMRHHAVPGVVYTLPEVATVGLTEAQAAAQGRAVRAAKMPMSASGRFLAENEGGRGLVKVVVDARTEVLLGVHMIGGACSESIFGAAAMIEMEMRVKEIEEIVFPHPTVCELIRDTVLAAGH